MAETYLLHSRYDTPNNSYPSELREIGSPSSSCTGSVTPVDSTVTTVTTPLDPVYYRVATHFPYTSVNVGTVNGQRLKLNTVNSQSLEKSA